MEKKHGRKKEKRKEKRKGNEKRKKRMEGGKERIWRGGGRLGWRLFLDVD